MPTDTPDIVIVESTYGVASHSPREEREQLFVQMVRNPFHVQLCPGINCATAYINCTDRSS